MKFNITTAKTFQTDVIESEVPVLVFFGIGHNDNAKIAGKAIQSVDGLAKGRAKVFVLEMKPENLSLILQLRLGRMPTVLIFINGKEEFRFEGPLCIMSDTQYLTYLGITEL